MFCKHCGTKSDNGGKFCKNCGGSISESEIGHVTHTQHQHIDTIKCGNCDYIGPGEKNRRTFSMVLAWMCVVFAPLITIIYFVANPKYNCPKCKSTFVALKNKHGVYDKPRTSNVFKYAIITIVGIAALGLISTIIAAPIQNARKKAREANANSWISYVSTEDSFTALLPAYPSFKKKEGIPIEGRDMTYSYHQYQTTDDTTSYFIFKYIYSEKLEVEDEDVLLKSYVKEIATAAEGSDPVSSFSYYDGYRSLDFSFSLKDESVKGRAILVNETPYLIMMDYDPAKYNEEKYSKFINSFKFQ